MVDNEVLDLSHSLETRASLLSCLRNSSAPPDSALMSRSLEDKQLCELINSKASWFPLKPHVFVRLTTPDTHCLSGPVGFLSHENRGNCPAPKSS